MQKIISICHFHSLNLKNQERHIPQFRYGFMNKSILSVTVLLLLVLLLNPIISLGQISKSELKHLQNETNFKVITLAIFGINNDTEAIKLKNSIEALSEVHNCEVDYKDNQCTIIAGFTIQKEDILGITGPAGIKTSNYSEDIRWQNNHLSKNKITLTNEMEQAKEVTTTPEEEEKVKEKIRIEKEERRKLEIELNAKLAQERVTTAAPENNLPKGYPKNINTGNQIEDDNNYAIAKEEWIRNNPEKYRRLSVNPESQVTEIPMADFRKMSAEKQKHIKGNPSKFKIIE